MMYRKDLFDELRLTVGRTTSDYLNLVKTIDEASISCKSI